MSAPRRRPRRARHSRRLLRPGFVAHRRMPDLGSARAHTASRGSLDGRRTEDRWRSRSTACRHSRRRTRPVPSAHLGKKPGPRSDRPHRTPTCSRRRGCTRDRLSKARTSRRSRRRSRSRCFGRRHKSAPRHRRCWCTRGSNNRWRRCTRAPVGRRRSDPRSRRPTPRDRSPHSCNGPGGSPEVEG